MKSRFSRRSEELKARRSRRRRTEAGMSPEQLEKRQLMAVDVWSNSNINGGWVSIVGEPGDNIFVQKVATEKNQLFVDDDSSFAPESRREINFIDGIEKIFIKSGVHRQDQNALPTGYPMSEDFKTTFVLSGPGAVLSGGDGRLEGTLSYVQPNGSISRWGFSNGQASEFGIIYSNSVRFTGGLAYSEPVGSGQVFPTAIEVVNAATEGAATAIQISWNVRQLPVVPIIEELSWYFSEFEIFNYDAVPSLSERRTERGLMPSAPREATIVLPNAAGPSLNPILPETFRGTLDIDGIRFMISTEGPSALNPDKLLQLRFRSISGDIADNAESEDGGVELDGDRWAIWSKAGHYTRYITGVLDVQNRRITLTTAGSRAGYAPFDELPGLTLELSRRVLGTNRVTTSYPGPISLSASYSLASTVGAPVNATIFAGLDITNAIDVDLSTPGSRFDLDSPVKVAATRSSGIDINATEVNFNAPSSTAESLRVGRDYSQDRSLEWLLGSPTGKALAPASAVADIVGGMVTRLTIPPGFGGAGYDPDNPPEVVIAPPTSRSATARLGTISNGTVTSIIVDSAGTGYTAAPTVRIGFPGGLNPRRATAVGVLSGVSLGGVSVLDGGAGYVAVPTVTVEPSNGAGSGARASARVSGSIRDDVVVTDGGSGYVPNTSLPVEFRSASGGSGATGFADVNANGSIYRVRVTDGGVGYVLDVADTLIIIPAPPVITNPDRARAEAIVDPQTTRIVGFRITHAGSGYGERPAVRVESPIPVADAKAVRATVAADGGVSSVAFSNTFGSGLRVRVTGVDAFGSVLSLSVVGGGASYAINDIVTINSGRASTDARPAGEGARFKVLEVDAAGAVKRLALESEVSGGLFYERDEEITHTGAAARGYGYATAPLVVVGRPAAADGRQATVVAVIDSAGQITRFDITDPGAGYDAGSPPAVAVIAFSPRNVTERVSFNSVIGAAKIFDIRTADDRFTPLERTRVYVSPSGNLVGDGTEPAKKVYVEARGGDVIVSGRINAIEQSYLLQSYAESAHLLPFTFTTTAVDSGVPTGLIAGETVAVTLANDLDTPLQGAVGFNDVSLRTDIESLRIRAASRDGAAVTNPFPYKLAIEEADGIGIDAVAASTFPIRLSANGDMFFRAALATAGGLVIDGVDAFTVTAPLSTTSGQIVVSAESIKVENSLRVTDELADESHEDIVLNASSGDILLNGGLVSAVNRIVLNQKNRRGGERAFFAPATVAVPITDFTTAKLEVEVTGSFKFDALKVRLNVRHSDNRNLSATLIAPNGSRYRLFSSFEASGTNLSNTVFDSGATDFIFNGRAPYAGSFRPIDGFFPALRNQNAAGKWTLEVSDFIFGDVGSLTGFALFFNDPELLTSGTISGSSLVSADSLQIEAQGSVGDPTLLPGDTTFHLRTDVNTVSAVVDGSLSISEAGDLDVPFLQAGGLVTLRAYGVDPEIDDVGNVTRAALRGSLTDVRQIDVSAPNGSVDVVVNTPGEILVGNAKALGLSKLERAGKVVGMQAAGSVSIVSLGGTTGGNLVVLDAPFAGSSATKVRYATVSALSNVTYDPGNAGTRPSRITSNGPESLDGLLTGGAVRKYSSGSGAVSIPDNRPASPATMQINVTDDFVIDDISVTLGITHRSLADLTATLVAPNGAEIRLFGKQQLRGSNMAGTTFDSEALQAVTRASSPFIGTFRPSASLTPLYGTNAKGIWTLRVADSSRRDFGTLNRFDLSFGVKPTGPVLNVGDRVLVANGYVQPSAEVGIEANGIYIVRNPGSPSTNWVLERAAEADTNAEFPSRSVVAVTDGAAAGRFYRVIHAIKDELPYGFNDVEVLPVNLATKIGSADRNDTLLFVVSTPDGTNESPGSLGKMIGLRQANVPPVFAQPTDFRFSTGINAPIQLTQELPAIEKVFAIDGARTYRPTGSPVAATPIFIDGSRITTTRRNVGVGFTTVVNGIEFRPTSAGSSLANVTMGGFRQGSAVVVDGAQNVVIDAVKLGINPTDGNSRLVNGNGVLVTASGASATTGTTIRNSQIYGSGKAGVSIQGAASGVSIYGNKIGDKLLDNVVGVAVSSSGSGNAIGLVGQLRNTIAYNYDGIVLSKGSTVVANTTINNNTFDGIRIEGGSHQIGSATTRAASSNTLNDNGRWGVSILQPAVASAQKIIGNFFGATVAGVGAVANRGGSIGIDGRVPAAALGWTPDAKSALDKQGNQHGAAVVAGPGPGPTPTPNPSPTPRRRRVWFA
jgi:subtilisin-like proprotein convertase family protein